MPLRPEAAAADTRRVGELSVPTRIVVGILWASFAAVVVFLVAVCWFMFKAMGDPLLVFLMIIVGPLLLHGVMIIFGGLPGLLRFVVNFSSGEPSAYYGGFVPAVVMGCLSLLFASVALPAIYWLPPLGLAVATVGLLLHPETRTDFLRRDMAGSDVRAAKVFWVDREPQPNGGP